MERIKESCSLAEIAEVVMNPVRQRIFPYFLLNETGTVKELKKHRRMPA